MSFKKSIVIALMAVMLLSGCHGTTRSRGGNIELKLEPGQKLEEITWKEYDLWYLTRPMRDDEEPETYVFRAYGEFHAFEGTVTIIESR